MHIGLKAKRKPRGTEFSQAALAKTGIQPARGVRLGRSGARGQALTLPCPYLNMGGDRGLSLKGSSHFSNVSLWLQPQLLHMSMKTTSLGVDWQAMELTPNPCNLIRVCNCSLQETWTQQARYLPPHPCRGPVEQDERLSSPGEASHTCLLTQLSLQCSHCLIHSLPFEGFQNYGVSGWVDSRQMVRG